MSPWPGECLPGILLSASCLSSSLLARGPVRVQALLRAPPSLCPVPIVPVALYLLRPYFLEPS